MTHLARLISTTILAAAVATAGCVGELPPDAIEPVLDSDEAPPEFTPEDAANAEVLTLTFVTYAAVALVATIAAVVVYESARPELEAIVSEALERRAFEDELRREEQAEAAHLGRAVNRGFYRNHSFGGYWINTTDLLQVLNQIDGASLSTTAAFGEPARRYMRSLRVIASKARLRPEYRDGGCVKARVRGREAPYPWYEASARYYSPEDVLAAASYASLKAMARCALYDADVMETFYDLAPDSPPSFSLDTFIGYGWKSTRFLYEYGRKCSLPPALAISRDPAGCQ